MKKLRNASLIPLFALLVMMVAVQGCPPGNGNGNGDGNGELPEVPCLAAEKDDGAYPIIIKVEEGVAFTEEPLDNTEGPDVSVTGADGLPNTLQWYNDSDYAVEIQFNEHYTWITLPPKTYSYVHRLNENLTAPLSMSYIIVATELGGAPGTPDVDVGP